MADSDDDDVIVVFFKDHAPLADAQSCAGPAFQAFYIAFASGNEIRKARIDPPSNVVRKFDPLPRRRWREEDLLHA